MSERKIVLKKDLISGFEKIGLKKGDNVIVHTSLKSFGFVCGGPQIVIEALLETVGETGTILMPAQTWKNLDPTAGVHWEEPQEWWDLIRQNWPAYDKNITPTNTMGAVAEMFRKWVTYETLVVDGEDFEQIGAAFEESNPISVTEIGNATVKCMSQRAIVDFAVKWIEANRK